MRYFLLITVILCGSTLIVNAQDTTKAKDTIAQLRALSLRRFKHSFSLLPPYKLKKERQTEDSIRRTLLPPEGRHPILYVDAGFGYTFAGLRGIEGNYSLNYQYKMSLFTLRGLGTASYRSDPTKFIDLWSRETGGLAQYSFLYGLRFSNNEGHAYSFSAGIADDRRSVYSYYDKIKTVARENYAGIPFEADYQWYTHRFGASFNIKFMGDVSKHSFAAIGVAMGLGYHTSH